jgi:hypothetical protein
MIAPRSGCHLPGAASESRPSVLRHRELCLRLPPECDRNRAQLLQYLGGTGPSDEGVAIAVDAAGSAYVAGPTNSTNFLLASGLVDTANVGVEAFIAKCNAAGAVGYSKWWSRVWTTANNSSFALPSVPGVSRLSVQLARAG